MEEFDKLGLIPCGCGCGQFRTPFDKKGRMRQFIYGHSKAGRFTHGFKHKEESKLKMSLHRSGENHGMWKGGRYQLTKGYYVIWKPEHHFANKDGYVLEHRLVWEEYHKVILLPWADVHHLDGNKTNNVIENLEAMMHGHHSTLTQKTVRWA
jgi:hypothetical protein